MGNQGLKHQNYEILNLIGYGLSKFNDDFIKEFGFSSSSRKSEKRNFDAESLMLTGDENIVDIEFQIQFREVSNLKRGFKNPGF